MNTEAQEHESTGSTRGRQKIREGRVVSAKMDKTAVVAITVQIKHPQYKKYVKRTRKFFAHDQRNECQEGDMIRIVETRPLSKNKRWRVQEIISKAL